MPTGAVLVSNAGVLMIVVAAAASLAEVVLSKPMLVDSASEIVLIEVSSAALVVLLNVTNVASEAELLEDVV